MTDAPAAVNPLRRRTIDYSMLRRLSPATQPSYLHAVTRFSRLFQPLPASAGAGGCARFQGVPDVAGIFWPALNQMATRCGSFTA
ncbi:hypothetical protein [Sinorhizobium americanum]|uniref:hypothetical protein n=1 Tax=Sinorhizobium americanum TaxID=194963 RepID=UPI000ADACE56|nr:hypothetical protein [Sinorhizobium americanum]